MTLINLLKYEFMKEREPNSTILQEEAGQRLDINYYCVWWGET